MKITFTRLTVEHYREIRLSVKDVRYESVTPSPLKEEASESQVLDAVPDDPSRVTLLSMQGELGE